MKRVSLFLSLTAALALSLVWAQETAAPGEILHRDGVAPEEADEALAEVAQLRGVSRAAAALSLARAQPDELGAIPSVLANLPREELAEAAEDVLQPALHSGSDSIRGLAAAGLLRSGSGDGILIAAVRDGYGTETLEALGSIRDDGDDGTLTGLAGAIRACLPGGALASSLPEAGQALAIGLFARAAAEDQYPAAVRRLARIADLTPVDGLRTAAVDAMKRVGEEHWPEGFAKYAGGVASPAQMELGREVYMRPAACVTCHQPDGKGLAGVFPPLAGSDWIDGDTERQIKIAVWGLMGEITVSGETFNNAMIGQGTLLTDEEIAAALTYVNNSWGNQGGTVSAEEVAKVKAELSDRPIVQPWMVEEILAAHPLRSKSGG